MATQLEDGFFKYNWSQFLALIELVAFGELNLHKIYTYAFDLRPHLYEVLEENGFKREAILNSHCLIEKEFKDVVIHSLVNKYINLRKVEKQDVDITYEWANNSIIRRYSLTQSVITQESHRNWFFAKLSDVNCYYFIAEKNNKPIGTFRLDIDSKGSGYISYLVDPKYHGEGFGGEILRRCVRFARENPKIINVVGEVMHENQASIRAFENLGFIRLKDYPDPIVFKLITS
jgi:RimJ/RimL family protein N-acetyltransferase